MPFRLYSSQGLSEQGVRLGGCVSLMHLEGEISHWGDRKGTGAPSH